MKEQDTPHGSPFVEPLKPTDLYDTNPKLYAEMVLGEGRQYHFSEISTHPEFIIRILEEGSYELPDWLRKKDISEVAHILAQARDMLRIEEISVPTEFVVGKTENTNKRVVYILTKRIIGNEILCEKSSQKGGNYFLQQATDPDRINFRQEVKKIFSSLIAYYTHALDRINQNKNAPFPTHLILSDICHPRQYMYGYISSEEHVANKQKKIFMVDADYHYIIDSPKQFYASMETVAYVITQIEHDLREDCSSLKDRYNLLAHKANALLDEYVGSADSSWKDIAPLTPF